MDAHTARSPARPTARTRSLLLVGALVIALVLGCCWRSPVGTASAAPSRGAGMALPMSVSASAVSPGAAVTNPYGIFVPVVPCRVVDTRQTGGRFASGETRSYDIAGPIRRSIKGDGPDRCGVPEYAVAITGSLTATGASGSGFVRTWPFGATEPAATALNYLKSSSIGTGVVLKLAPVEGLSLSIKNYAGPTHLVLDVTGYYAEQMHVQIDHSGYVTGSRHVLSATKDATAGRYTLTFDRDLRNCSALASAEVSLAGASAFIYGAQVWLSTWVGSSDGHTPSHADADLLVIC